MTKRKTAPKDGASDTRDLRLSARPGEIREQSTAQIAAAGMLENAYTVKAFGKGLLGDIGISEVLRALRERADGMSRGDLSGAEAMLVAQASSLNAIFTEMAIRAAANVSQDLGATEIYMRLALKAQAQCRATLEALAAIKAGPVVIARQANIAHGPQQVNNGVSGPVRANARAGNSDSTQNELLSANDGERLDSGATGAASGGNPALEALGAVHRPA